MAGGHECSGTIVAKGSAVGDTYAVGDRVSVVYDYCGYCDECKHGEVTGCENIKQFGHNYSDEYYGIFGFANYFVRKAKSFVKMNPDLSPSESGFCRAVIVYYSKYEKTACEIWNGYSCCYRRRHNGIIKC